jgi:hypothetical protein
MKLLSPPVVVIALCATVPAHADTITLAALEGYVTILPSGVTEGPYSPDAFGTFVGQIGHFQSGTPLLPWEARSVFEFDLGAIDPATVTAAAFSFVPVSMSEFGFSCFDFASCPTLSLAEVLSYSGNGMLERDDYHAGAAFVGRIPPALGAPASFDATAAVRGNTTGFAGFTINPGIADGGIGVHYAALQIEFDAAAVPEPASIGLVAGGLFMVAAVLRRRSKRP